jgi:hypothetical protein
MPHFVKCKIAFGFCIIISNRNFVNSQNVSNIHTRKKMGKIKFTDDDYIDTRAILTLDPDPKKLE